MKSTIAAALSALAFALVGASAAQADFGITSFGASVDRDGDFSRQAGEHADLSTTMMFSTRTDEYGQLAQDGEVKTIKVDLPPGVVGNPTAAPTCANAQLVNPAYDDGKSANCPIASQIGVATIYASSLSSGIDVPIYNMAQPVDLPGLFALNYTGAVVRFEPRVRSTDYGINVTVPEVSQAISVLGAKATFWAVPSDPSHDALRYTDPAHEVRGAPSSAPRLPFLTNPTSCGSSPSRVVASANSWQNPGALSTAAVDADADGTPFVTTGCDRLAFNPNMTAQPGSQAADSPTGLNVDLSVPQNDDPDGLATAQVRKAVVTLPEGMSVSPSSAAGLGACALSEISLGSDAEPTCPASSKIGTVTIETPLLKDPLEGDVILAKQDDNPFRSLLALYIVAKGPGVLIKLPGRVDPDPVTGQLTTTFDNNPQLPFSNLHLAFRGGPRAPLATPTACGRYNTHAEITSWASDVPVKLDTPMVIDSGCGARPLATSFAAGVADPSAGASSPFTFTVTRADRTQYLSGIDAVLPPGLLGRIGTVPQCVDDQAATGNCPAESQIGTTSALSGPGESPLSLKGRVYLTGPYKDAPFGMSIVVPTAGQAGPFDLGNVVVRAAIYVDRTDAHVTVKSDPLPTIIQGIPLRLRQVTVAIDREGFMLNPTGCKTTSVFAAFTSVDGQTLGQEARFQPIGCGELPLAPKLSLRLTGKNATTDGTHPGVEAKLTMPSYTTNIKTARVALPLSLALEPGNAQALCKPEQRAALACPATSIVGKAVAQSVLPHPLTGPVYFVEGTRKSATGRTIRTLPKLWIPLSADGVTIDVNADSAVALDRLITTFDNVPDAPISSFSLSITGGKHGIIVVSGKPGACDRSKTVDNRFVGQNGVTKDTAFQLTIDGCKLHVVSSKGTSKSVTLKLGGLGAGRLTLSGAKVVRASQTIQAAAGASVGKSVTVKLTKSAKRALQRSRRLAVRVTATLRPKKGKSVKVSKTVTVKLPARKAGR